MKANEFVDLELGRLYSFRHYWRRHINDPNFPEDLDEPEWREQYEIFRELKEDDK